MSHGSKGNDLPQLPLGGAPSNGTGAFAWGQKRTDRAVRRRPGVALLPGLEKLDGLIVLEEERIRARTVR
ncbi:MULTISPECIES: hypothetical protein [Streptomyces]|uniref:Uncharacterized protein n=2 Tax=Streptomyces TaxID=1883 RepID=A0A2N8PLT6_STRNR|nr:MULTISPECIES: hypothetical protein [Streptomyces]PNE41987.1 hypothetical protein AOB60_15570 [Streptomyces noursei]SHN03181.1 hypothetical protein SAMN05216268_11815 [Streptomyces yunnanensis]